ncbi:MAG: hypothetical protein Q4G67_00745 [Actinomycetia bacterium]|nr:hypothetical protein [Actinomycetes bacterium]
MSTIRIVREWRNEIGLLIGLLVLVVVLAGRVPTALLPGASVAAAPLLLNAVGVILIYRASGTLNLAQVQIGVFAGILFEALVRGQKLLQGVNLLCEPCVGATPSRTAQVVGVVVALVLAVAAATLISWLIHLLVIQRFRRAPVLMSTVATVFLAQALAGLQPRMLSALVSSDDIERGRALRTLDVLPLQGTVTILGSEVALWSVLLVIVTVAVLGWLSVLLRRGSWGLALRATSSNTDRARTLGINTGAVARRAWVWAGLMAGLSGVLSKAASGGATPAGSGEVTAALAQSASALVLLLTVVVFARFTSLAMASAAAVVISFVTLFFTLVTASVAPVQAGYVFVIGLLLLIQRAPRTRAVRQDTSDLGVTRELAPIPRELRSLEQVRSRIRLGALVLGTLLLGGPVIMSVGTLSLMIDTFIFGIVALSLLVLTGWAGQVSLGQFGFVAIGAWTAAVSGAPFLLAVVLAAAVGALVSVAVGLPALRLRGMHLAVSTLAFAVSLQAILFDRRFLGRFIPEWTAPPTFLGLDLGNTQIYYYLTLAVLALACLAVLGLRRSRFGRALIALRSNEAGAQAFGISPTRARLTAFAVSGGMAALAGGVGAFHIGALTAATYPPEMSISVFLYTLVGGLGGISGPLLGTAFYAAVSFFFSGNALITYAGAGIGAVFLLIAVPGGLAQLFVNTRDAMLVRLAYRLRIPVPSLMGDGGVAARLGKAPLEEKRRPVVPEGADPLPEYRLRGQWALDRLGSDDQLKERVGDDRRS